ncbi:hypothetical protein EHQ43_02480 [Leptospira bouyouniensis]|uniref:Gluconate 2-dehydrogenase subunit 3 family protein n=2 Tax=Leptospira bouyouniensis TaxID=2484911 RepID=A0A7I0HUM5_9LEPT|nr:hypothetical protein EHQ43_02480 [Leptospira bouyouniensis]
MNIHSLICDWKYGLRMAILNKKLISRRTVVKTSLVGAVFLYLSTSGCKSGEAVSTLDRGLGCRFLDHKAEDLFYYLSDSLLFHFLPKDKKEKEKVLGEVVQGIDSYLYSLPSHTQKEILEAIQFLNLSAVRWYLFGSSSNWELTNRDTVIKTLNQWKISSISLIRSIYFLLQSMVTIGFFETTYSWKHIGYPGPGHALGLRHG